MYKEKIDRFGRQEVDYIIYCIYKLSISGLELWKY